ncbi:hypothetical protein [Novosphingobium sp. PhB55]|uniref:hypothetical protein n=1 Tax=Novosphingobium sp. PhB55 TaxID=2485106 RepID=UPI0010660766|nr:hypothetical protein [Novosphingobium sp. PhB55]
MSPNISFQDLDDFLEQKANLEAVCGTCGHRGVLDAAKVYRWFLCHAWNTATAVAHLHLRCSKCKGRPGSIRPSSNVPDRPRWMSSQQDWSNLTRRLRN